MNATNSSDHTFLPQPFVNLDINRTRISIYPKVTSSMLTAERSFAFIVTKAALESADIPMHTKLSLFGQYMDQPSLVNILQHRYITHAESFIKTAGNFDVTSYHTKNGVVINNAIDPSTGQLFSCDGVDLAERRPSNIAFAKLHSNIDFTSIFKDHTNLYPLTFYVSLPQNSKMVTDKKGENPTQLTTFYGDNDWATSSSQAYIDSLWTGPGQQTHPFILEAPLISGDRNADARISFDPIKKAIKKFALEACWDELCYAMRERVTPNVSQSPTTIIQEIHQVFSDKNGKVIKLSVEAYFKAIERLISFLPNEGNWDLDVVQHFLTHLDPSIRDLMEKETNFSYNGASALKDAYSQNLALTKAYTAAISAEKVQSNIKKITQETLESNHALLSTSLLSSAEETMIKHGRRSDPECWGCKQKGHVYIDKNGNILCPRGHEPAIKAAAEEERQKYLARMKERRNNKKRKFASMLSSALEELGKKKSGGDDKDKLVFMSSLCPPCPSFCDQAINSKLRLIGDKPAPDSWITYPPSSSDPMAIANSASDEFVDQVLQVKKAIDGSESDSSDDENHAVLITTVSYNSQAGIRPNLPINIDSLLPHVVMQVGTKLENSVGMTITYDSGAALNIGSKDYHLTLARKFPHIVKSLTWCKDDYSPLRLSGIVKDDATAQALSTSLPAVIEYHMPYKSKTGASTSFKVALGSQVAVNTIIGMSMIRAGKFSLDLEADVMDPGILDTAPFPLIFKPASCSVPDLSNAPAVPVSENTSVTPSIIDKCRNDVFAYDLETEDEDEESADNTKAVSEEEQSVKEPQEEESAKAESAVKWEPFLSESK